MVRLQLETRGIHDKRVLQAMSRVPRHLFVSERDQVSAYGDFPLAIGEGQTISQPFMVALMTQHLCLSGIEKVLEVGTGSGYQTAVLAELAQEVISMERIPSLADRATTKISQLGYDNVKIVIGDGTHGRPESAPYHCILVTAGSPKVPAPLLEQLRESGRLVIPVGDRYDQTLEIHIRGQSNQFTVIKDIRCRFVDLIGDHGW